MVSKTQAAVLAAESGLGIVIIEKTPIMRLPYVVATELGHLQIPMNREKSDNYESEFNLIQYISDEIYEGK
jgi:glucokinase